MFITSHRNTRRVELSLVPSLLLPRVSWEQVVVLGPPGLGPGHPQKGEGPQDCLQTFHPVPIPCLLRCGSEIKEWQEKEALAVLTGRRQRGNRALGRTCASQERALGDTLVG